MLADDDLYLDDAYAFLVQQSRLQHQHHHKKHHHLSSSGHKHHKSNSANNTTDLSDHSSITMKSSLPAHSHIAHLHNLLQQQQQVAASNSSTGMTDEQHDAAMATAAALSLCALDNNQGLHLSNATLAKLPPRIMKILYVDAELEEKEAAAKLEEVTSVLYEQHDGSIICSFTVIANSMAAMESTEHVDYDAIFIAEGKNATFNFINKRGSGNSNSHANIIKGSKVESADISAYDFLRILRMVGSTVPMILLTSSHDLSYSNSIYKASSRGLPAIGFDTITDRFAAVLQRPYRSKDICHIISQIIAASNNSSDSAAGMLSTTDSMTELDDVIMRETTRQRANEPPTKSARINNTTSSGTTGNRNNNCIQSTIHRTTSSTSTSSVFTVMGQIGGPFNPAGKFNP